MCTLLLVLGVPVAFALGGGTLVAILASGNLSLLALPKTMFSGIDIFALEAVPFFILTAELMTGGALSEVLLRFASQFVGRFRGGMGHTNILTLTFFSGISGSALADAAGPGAIMIRMMKDDGYKPEYAAALPIMTFTLPMMFARLSEGAVTTLAAGFINRLIARAPLWPAAVQGVIILLLFLPAHYKLWHNFPVWYHLTFLGCLIPLTIIGAALVPNRLAKIRT